MTSDLSPVGQHDTDEKRIQTWMQTGDPRLVAATALVVESEYASAEPLLKEALASGLDARMEAEALGLYGLCLKARGAGGDAVDALERAFSLSKSGGWGCGGFVDAYANGLCAVYATTIDRCLETHDYEGACARLVKLLDLIDERHDMRGFLTDRNRGLYFFHQGMLLWHRDEPNGRRPALECFSRVVSSPIRESLIDNKLGAVVGLALHNMGGIHFLEGEFAKAIPLLRQALAHQLDPEQVQATRDLLDKAVRMQGASAATEPGEPQLGEEGGRSSSREDRWQAVQAQASVCLKPLREYRIDPATG